MIEGGYIFGGTLLLCGAAIYRQRLNQAAQLAAIRPKSSLEKVLADVADKTQYVAKETATALLPVAKYTMDAANNASSATVSAVGAIGGVFGGGGGTFVSRVPGGLDHWGRRITPAAAPTPLTPEEKAASDAAIARRLLLGSSSITSLASAGPSLGTAPKIGAS